MYKKTFTLAFLFAVLMISGTVLNSQTVDQPYEVGVWQGFREAAITYTFDDWTPKQHSVAIPILNEFDFDATFFPVISWSPNWTNLNSAVATGHEVGSHTVNHSDLSGLTAEQQDTQLESSQSTRSAVTVLKYHTSVHGPFIAFIGHCVDFGGARLT